MNYLGIDYGTRKIGLAINVENISVPLKIIENKSAVDQIKQIVNDRKIDQIIIGIADHVNGRESDHSRRIKSFSGILRKDIGIDVIFHDERFSSFEAKTSMENIGMKKFDSKRLDDVAACIILQSYLDSKI
ncbi:MAG: Holliday junction resolvase RuvX [Candidatus Gracilibacteria bacterium]|nr:Holliday junction resolvase RuvX [Candidatus Gracilibacteria bacterium]